MGGHTTRATELRVLRRAKGLTQEQLAAHAGISRQSYAAIESGNVRPSVDIALRIARTLGTSVETLFLADGNDHLTVPLVGPQPAGPLPVRLAEVGGRLLAFPTRQRGAGVAYADGAAEPLGDGRVRVRPFRDRPPSPDLVVAGCDPAFALVAEALRHRGVEVLWVQVGSLSALKLLARGHVHVAGVHLMDPETSAYNAPWVAREVPGPCSLVRFATWEESLLVAEGNPLGVVGMEDVTRPGTRFVNREEGSGSRSLIDRSLSELGLSGDQVDGYHTTTASSHLEVASAVAAGTADAGVGIRAAGALYGLHAVPLAEEPYDLAIPTPLLDLPSVQALIDVLRTGAVRDQVGALGGYDTSTMGSPV